MKENTEFAIFESSLSLLKVISLYIGSEGWNEITEFLDEEKLEAIIHMRCSQDL